MGVAERIQAAWGSLRGGSIVPLSFDEWVSYFNFNQNTYGFMPSLNQTMPGQREEEIEGTYGSIVGQAYKRNGIVFACMLARMLIFSEARFQFQQMRGGRPGELFGTTALERLEKPGPNQTTGDLLARMMQDADLAGNWYGARRGNGIKRMRPDWVTIVLGSETDPSVDARDLDAEVLGYLYHPGGRYSGITPTVLMPNEVAHFAPIPDPLASFRGMSWITPVIREVMGDSAATSHKLAFFENAATPNMVVSLDKDVALQTFKDWIEEFKKHEPKGFDAYQTLYLGGGAVPTVVGKDLQQIDFKVTQGAGETRIAAAAGIHPVIVGLSEGMQGSSLNAGNFTSARRLTADRTFRPLWRNASGSLESIIDMPQGSRLWIDDKDIPFLQEDVKDAADIQVVQSQAINNLVSAGFEPDTIVDAITAGDWKRLSHTGLYSVQLQPPMPDGPPKLEAPTQPLQIPANAGRSVEDLIADSEERLYRALDRPTVAPITFADGAFRIDPQITVHTPEQPASVVNVTVPEQAAPNVTFEEGAIRATVEAPPPAEFTINVPEQAPPVVTFEEGAIRVDAPPPADVTVNMPEQEPPQVTVNLPEPKATRKTVKRDTAGRITEVTETPDGD